MGLGVAQDEAQLRPKTPFSRPRTFKNEGQKTPPKKDTNKYDEGAKIVPEMGPKSQQKKGLKNRPQHNQPQLRLPRALRGRGPAVSGENAGEVVVVGVVCRMWPRTKRNVVEAKGLVKDRGRAVLGLPKEPQPQNKINERG